jgi:ABC-type Fe3+ transport system permease subunit
VRSAVSSDNSSHDINTAAAEASEKPAVNKWQRRAKKKLWGIVPYWAICLLLVGLVLMGIIMGAVIGTMLTKNHPPPPPDVDE